MTRAQQLCSPMLPSSPRARPCASAHSCATDSTVLRTLAPRATPGDLICTLRLALAAACASHDDRTACRSKAIPPIQSP
jgi:hypothetical protein